MTASKIFLYFCLSFIAGIFISSLSGFLPGGRQIIPPSGLIFGILLISVLWQYKKAVVIGFSIIFLFLGIWRHQLAELKITNSELRKFNDKEKTVTLIGVISKEPDLREKTAKLTVGIKKIEILRENGSPQADVGGRVLVTASRYPEYQYGDKLRITGKLETPPVFEGFNYKDYLKKDGIYSVMTFPETESAGSDFGNPVIKLLFSFKNKFKRTAQNFIPLPEIGILEALSFGDEQNISKEWKDKLNFTGTRHIAAVSGMNITIISGILFSFLLSLGLWRQQAFYLSLLLIAFYILMIGAPSSALRAGLMAGLFLTAQHLGRGASALRAVIFAAAFILIFNPLLLMSDIGFQLSFLAILGMIFFQPVFSDFFKKIPNPKFFPVRTTLSATISAQIFTLPILLYNFGYFSLVSLPANILIVPFLAPITILILVFGLLGMIFLPLGWVSSFPVFFSLLYVVKIIDLFSKFPLASLKLENLHWIWLSISYLILSFAAYKAQESQKLKFLKY